MRKIVRLPRILKINWVKDMSVSVVFNNGQTRIINFKVLFESFGVKPIDPEHLLFNQKEFAKVELVDYTLSWRNVKQYITMIDGKREKLPYEIGPDVLYKYSKPERKDPSTRIGRLIKEARIKSGLTQQELAEKSGTTRNYISRIENDRSDIELDTLRKIIEIGLGKKLRLVIS
jgi:DNA-binding XRE family transcriptional regulator